MKCIDLHQDLLLHIRHPEHFPSAQNQTSFSLIQQARTHITIATSFPLAQNNEWHVKSFFGAYEADFVTYATLSQEHGFTIALSADDVARTIEDGTYALLLHIEGLNAMEDTEEDWEKLEHLYALGLRSLGIVWNKTNALGGGTEDFSTGLSSLGKKVLRWCIERSVLIDCAHMNEPTFWDTVSILEQESKPVYVSHGNARTVCAHPRNYSDDQLRVIGSSQGVIGIFFSGKFVATEHPPTIDDIQKHVEHIRACAGETSLALGSDFGGITTGLPESLRSVTDISLLRNQLEQTYAPDVLDALFYKNALRVLTTYLPAQHE